ncbi:mechanosensitive ion channel [Candidatus Peregrinibacteria bacterium]|nr:mechanosensitive ion channel [Candidatus Peregrinibacteria bacterium]
MFDQLVQLLTIPIAFAQKVGTAEDVASGTQDQITGLVTFIVGQIPLWLTALVVLIATFILARVVKGAVESKMTQEGFEEEHKEVQIVAVRTANAAVLLIGVTVALKIAGLDLTPIIAAGAFGIGFALQDLIMNFLAGVMILSARHYSIGDVIKVNGTMGKIIEIQTRATVLKSFDGTKIVVPNAELFKNQVTSLTSNPMRRIKLPVYCRYGINLEDVMAICIRIVKQHSQILLEPKPSVFVADMGDYYVELGVRFWVAKGTAWFKLRSKVFMEIHKALEQAGFDAPYPVTSISMDEDTEGGVIKTYQMNKDDLKELQNMRLTYQQDADRVKEAYIQENAPLVSSAPTPDQSGVDFLKQPATQMAQPQISPVPQYFAQPQTAQPAPLPVQSVQPQAVQNSAPAQAPIMNVEKFDAPDWLKKAMDKNVPAPIVPAPMGVLTVTAQVAPAPVQPVMPQAVEPQQVIVQQPVQQYAPVETAPVQQPVAVQPAPVMTYEQQVAAPVMQPVQPAPIPVDQPAVAPTFEQPAPIQNSIPVPTEQLPVPEQPVVTTTPTDSIVVPTTI